MVKRQVGIDIPKERWLFVTLEDEDKKDSHLDSLVTVMKYNNVHDLFGEIVHRFFKGRYYSNKYNFAQVVNSLGITTEEYNDALNKLVNAGIIRKVKERVYELNKGYAILTRKDMKELTGEEPTTAPITIIKSKDE